MTYGTNQADMFRQLGSYAGRVLKGDKPANLPVLQPSKFELVINLQAAKMLGLTIPNKLLALAEIFSPEWAVDIVIEERFENVVAVGGEIVNYGNSAAGPVGRAFHVAHLIDHLYRLEGGGDGRCARVADREELIRAFEYLSLLRLGEPARHWHHRAIAARGL